MEMNRSDRVQKMDRYISDTKTEFTTQAFYIATSNVDDGAQALQDIPTINQNIQADFQSYIDSVYVPSYTPAGLQGMKFTVEGTPVLYLRWLEKDTRDVEENENLDVAGTIKNTKVYSHLEIIGQVNLTVTDQLTGSVTTKVIKIEEPFDSPYLLALNAIESMRNGASGDSSDIGRMARYMLFALAEMRSLNAINESAKLISDDEIKIAVNLAILLEEVRLFRKYDHNTAKAVTYKGQNLDDLLKQYLTGGSSVDPADLFIKFLGITKFNVTLISGGFSGGGGGGSGNGGGKKVFINPSDQYGNVGPTGYSEPAGAKDMADKLKAKLTSLGFDARVDQNFDNAPGNANSWGADIFISIHTNAAGPSAKGTLTIYPSTATGDRLSKSKTLAKQVNDELVAELSTKDLGIYADISISGHTLYVLRTTNMPAVLTEVAFHSNVEEEALLKTPEFRDKAATAMARAVCKYFNVDSSSLGSGGTGTFTPTTYTNYTVKLDAIAPNDGTSFIKYLVEQIKNADKNLSEMADNISRQSELMNYEYTLAHMYEKPFEFWNHDKAAWADALRMRWENFTNVKNSLFVPKIERSGTSFLIKGGSGSGGADGSGSGDGSGGASGPYDGYKALDYAWKYGAPGQNCDCGFNYNPEGGDCAHFVSHCIAAGGLEPYTSHGHAKGATVANGGAKFSSNGIHIGATAVCQWIVSSGAGVFVNSIDELCVGDVIEISGASHVILYTGKNAAGQPTFAAHNNNHLPGTVLYSGCDMMVHIKSNTAGKQLRDASGNPTGSDDQSVGGPALYLNTLNISLDGSFSLAGTAQSTVKDDVLLAEKITVDTSKSSNIAFNMKLVFPLYCPLSLDIAEPVPLNPGMVVSTPGGGGSSGGGGGSVPDSGVKINVLGYGEMDIEQYLRGVVPSESFPSWEIEALKAQAMAARSYAYYQIQHPKHGAYHVCTTTCCQVYNPSNINPRTDQAIAATSGLYVLYNGQVCHTFFSASCGGHTYDNEDVWGGSPLPYCRGVPCPDTHPKNGHGIGYCQWGGQVMAQQGKKYDEIIKYYYTGVAIGKLDGTIVSGPDSGTGGGATVKEHPVIEALENTSFFENVSAPITGKIIDIIMKSQSIFGKIGNSYVQSLYTKVPVEVLYRLLDITKLANVVPVSEMNAVMKATWEAYDKAKKENPTDVNHTLFGLLNKLKFNGDDNTLTMKVEQESYSFTLKFIKNPDKVWGFNYTYIADINANFRDFALDITVDPFRVSHQQIVHYSVKHTHGGKSWETEIALPQMKTPQQSYSLKLDGLYFPGSLRTLNVTFGVAPVGGSIGEFSAMMADCQNKIHAAEPNISHETLTYIMSEMIRKTMTDLSSQVGALKQMRFFMAFDQASDGKRLGNLTFAINITPNYNAHAEWLLQNIDNFIYHFEDSNTKAMFWQLPPEMRNDFKIIREKFLPNMNTLSTISVGWLWDDNNLDSLGSSMGMYPDIIDAVIASGYTAGSNLNQEKYTLVDMDNVPADAFSKYHILMITGHKPITFSDSLRNTLQKFVEDGGLLWIDNDRGYGIGNFFAPFELSEENSMNVKHWGDTWDTKKGPDSSSYPLLDGPGCPYPLSAQEIKDFGKVNSFYGTPNADYYWYWCTPYLKSAPGYDNILMNDNRVYNGPGDDGGDGKTVIAVKAIGKGHVLITANNVFDFIDPEPSIIGDVPPGYTTMAKKFFGNVLAWHKAYYSQHVLSQQPTLGVQLDFEAYETLHGASWGTWNVECYVCLPNVPSSEMHNMVPGATGGNSDVYFFYMTARET